MAKEKQKKGFFFYFGLFLLLIVAAVLVIFVVMLFMPGTSILGLEYFTNNSTIEVIETTDEAKTAINYDSPNFKAIEINAGYSSVTVQHNTEFKKSGVYITNRSKGFVTTKKATDFSYTAIIEDDTLKITVNEQSAFLYFSKNCEIVLQITGDNAEPFKDMPITIKNKDGSVDIGAGDENTSNAAVKLRSLIVENEKGGIYVRKLAPTYFEVLHLSTTSGSINLSADSVESPDMLIETSSGKVNAKKLISQAVQLKSTKGSFEIGSISGKLVGSFVDAYVSIDTVTAGVDLLNSPLSSSVIKIGTIENGGIATDQAMNTSFTIGSIKAGSATIFTSTGSITIEDGVRPGSHLSTASGSISAKIDSVAAENADDNNIKIETEKGDISLTIPNGLINVRVSNRTGNTNLKLDSEKTYSIKFCYYGRSEDIPQNLEQFKFDNVTLNNDEIELKNPLLIGNGDLTTSLVVKCDKQINFEWMKGA